MYEVSEKTKELYRMDLPNVKNIPRKQLLLSFENGLEVGNLKIHGGSFSFTESICDESNIKFGGCISSCLKIKIAGLEKDISGVRFSATHKIDGGDDIPYGNFTVDSAKLMNDSVHREIIAYDDIYGKLNRDVNDWYKSLALPLPLKTFRQSLFAYVGIPIKEQELVNDDMPVERTVEAATLNGVEVAKAIGEINGTFGIMSRGGKFKYIMLSGTGLYPAEDLYPSEDLYPAEATEQFGKTGYRETKYEEYSTAPIDCLQIRQIEGDVGAHSPRTGKWKNPYIITGNFLVYGKTEVQLQAICDNIFRIIAGTSYRPHTTKLNGLPYIEPGDSFTLEKKRDSIDSYVFSRTITGSQSLIDTWQASGDMYLQNEVSPNTEIEMLKGRSMVIKKSVEGLSVTVTNLEDKTNTKFEMTDREIALKVNYDKIISSINLSPENVRIQGKRIQLDGEVTFSNSNPLSLSSGTTVIDGGCLKTGTVDASLVKVENIDASNITTGSFNASLITAGTLDANKITVKNLVVGENVQMGANATISWSNVTGTGDVAYKNEIPSDSYITRITKNTVTTEYLNSKNITARYVEASGIKAGTISSVSLYFDLINGVFWSTRDGSWTCDSNAIYSRGHSIELWSSSGAVRIRGDFASLNGSMSAYGDIVAQYGNIRASHGIVSGVDWEYLSEASIKTNIKKAGSMLDALKNTEVYQYNYKDNLRAGKTRKSYGFVVGKGYALDKRLISTEGEGINPYNAIAILWKCVQEQQEQIQQLKMAMA